MIARHWRGLARADRADAYVRHLREETFPAIRRLPGFRSASILRRTVPEGVEFLIATTWESFEAIGAFAGADVETAVVPAKAQSMMIDFDRVVRHFEIVD